jgi:hypothetical protein
LDRELFERLMAGDTSAIERGPNPPPTPASRASRRSVSNESEDTGPSLDFPPAPAPA